MAKKIKSWVGTVWFTTLLTFIFFFLAIEPARAPRGGKNSLGGRTIASFQEEEFDRRLLNLQLCYGIRFNGERSTPARRRVCKALVVHTLDKALAPPGTVMKFPVEFRCEDTVFPKDKEAGNELLPMVVQLKPNEEFRAIEAALGKSLETITSSEERALSARETCEFLTDCKWAMRPQGISLRKLASCLTNPNIARRKILLDEFGAMLFRIKNKQNRILISQLLENTSE